MEQQLNTLEQKQANIHATQGIEGIDDEKSTKKSVQIRRNIEDYLERKNKRSMEDDLLDLL